MSDTGSSNCDNKPQQEDVNLEESQAQAEAAAVPEAEVENKPVTPVKRTPSKRLSAVERAQRESEELVKTLGGSLDIEGGRKTRSSTRGTPSRSNVVHTPPPTKRSRATTGTPKRGRGRKLETAIEDNLKTSPEKVASEPESNHDESESPAVVDAIAKTQDKIEDDDKPETTENPSEVAEEKPSPANELDKPEAMEVDGVSKETAIESDKIDENAQNESESSIKPNDEDLEKSAEKVVTEEILESSSKVSEDVVGPPSTTTTTTTDAEQNAPLGNENVETAHENNAKANDIEKVNSNALPAEVSLSTPAPTLTATPTATPTPTPATQVSVAGNEHKAESNDLCEPKLASPPITANNDGATPQYCN
ncbi:anti-sigma-I factor RsgI5 [Eupeodes corollae]|uniref:anti-sigma-I factor RsgI5 n=1 Tax=Eupeodes corollae TaxID=290404 RepID=UPI00248FABAB|nr:anti-sigma-I factor RsgI5 [Eupeodes corollae]